MDRAKAALRGTRFADLRWVPTTGSTNADLPVLLAERGATGGPPAPLVLVADHQTAGRGRLDRTWEDEPGASLLVSIGLGVADLPAERLTLLPSAVGAAAVDACSGTRLKWPNDLVAPGAGPDGTDLKLGGVLSELVDVDGVGSSVPAELTDVATSLDAVLGGTVDREVVLLDLLVGLDERWLPLVEPPTVDPEEFLAAYRARSATIGRRVRVDLGASILVGTAVDVAADGALVLEDDQRVRRVVSLGDVVHLRPIDD
jgi:BirA family biotin operon repressor/biotin-[acetyl-CoA-carboxylase] ligase